MRIRLTAAIVGAAFAALLIPAVASANVAPAVSCEGATFTWSKFREGAKVTRPWQVAFNGNVALSGRHTFTGPTSTLTVPIPPEKIPEGVFTAVASAGAYSYKKVDTHSAPVELLCKQPEEPLTPVPPKQEEPPVTVVTPPPPPALPPATTPKKPRVVDCKWIRDHYSGAPERKLLLKHGCIKITCQELKARGAGRSWYKRLGIRYFECHVPRPPRRPVLPPVTG